MSARRKSKMSPAQKRALTNLANGQEATRGLSGNSEWGGFSATWASLVRNNWADKDGITDAGREALAEASA